MDATYGACLPLLIAAPLIFAAVLIIFPNAKMTGRAFILISPALTIAFSALLLVEHRTTPAIAEQIGAWPAGISVAFVSDTFTALMLLATSLVILTCAAFSIASQDSDERYFQPLFLILSAGVAGALLTADLFNLFVFIELMFLPSCGLIVMRKGLTKLESSRLYVTVNLLTSAILVVGIGLIYGSTGTVNLAQLAGTAKDSNLVAGAFGVVLIALSVKSAIFPTHGWLTRTYPSASPVISALFSGLHTKVAIFAMYRIYSVAFLGSDKYLWLFTVLFAITMLIGALGALGETHLRSIFAFHMVSQVGYILLGLALYSLVGLAAGIFYLVHHLIVKASLFLTAGAIEETFGTGRLSRLSGLAKSNKVAAIAFFMAAMSIAGLPPFSGFVAKFNLLSAALTEKNYLATTAIVIVSIITLMSMLKIWSSVFWDREQTYVVSEKLNSSDTLTMVDTTTKIKTALIVPGLFLALVSLVIGLAPNALLDLSQRAASSLVNIEPWVKAVLGQ